MSNSSNVTLAANRRRHWFDTMVTFVRSNSSVVGAFLVICGLFVAQRYVGAWLTDASVVDESDLPEPALVVPAAIDEADGGCDPWVLTFSDEFDGEEIDDERWIRFNSPDRNGNGVRRPEALSIEDGLLVVTSQSVDGEIVSGALASRHQQQYGRFEARVRTEADPSEVMSGLILTWPAGNNHPEGGENDLYETLNTAAREPFYSYIHHGDTTREELVHDANAEEWHEVAMEWTPEAVAILRNDELVGTITEPDAIAAVPHVVSVQLVANSTEMTGDPVRMFVDWIRVYRANDSIPPTC